MSERQHTIKELLCNAEDYNIIGFSQQIVTNIQYDSRKVSAGTCFVAVQGTTTDGHNYIESALKSGASVIICEKLPETNTINNNVTFVITSNSRKCLAAISHKYYDDPSEKLIMIGVTGTNGKTTCTFLLKSIIESEGLNCGIIGTTGIFSGNKKIPATHTTPESREIAKILSEMVNDGMKYVIMEVSSHALVQHRTDYIKFKAAIFTNLTHDHLDYHKNMQSYAESKKLLFSSLEPDSFAIINYDSEWAEFMVEGIKCKNILTVGREKGSDYLIKRQKSDLSGIEYIILHNSNLINVITKLSGDFNIDNTALSAIAAQAVGISRHSIQHGLSITNGAPGRMEKIILKNNAAAIIDYAHTPDALQKALLTCKSVLNNDKKSKAKLICIFGCGGDRDKTKRPEMGKISSDIADLTIITSDNPRSEDPSHIINDIVNGINTASNYIAITDRAEAIKYAAEHSNSNDIILIAGKGHEDYQIIGNEKLHFDDKEEVIKYT